MDAKELEVLYNKWYVRLYHFARTIIKDDEMAKDMVQDVFIKLSKNECLSEDPAAFIMTLTKNRCRDYNKAKSWRIFVDHSKYELVDEENYFINTFIEGSVLDEMAKRSEKLPPQCAKIFSLILKGYALKEIAKHLHISHSSVLAQKAIAIKKLKKVLHV